MEQKTVFISYRRALGRYLARSIYQDLKLHGWDVFLDVNTIDSGDFDRIILNQIGARVHFVLLITPDSLQRCVNANDWVLREIEEAVRLDRNIVPIAEEGVDFQQEIGYLPHALRTVISKKNALPLNHFYFDSGMYMLRTRFLKQPNYIIINSVSETEQDVVSRHLAEVDEALATSPYTDHLVVDVRRSEAYHSISSALRAAPPGARIMVKPGIYQEQVVLDKPITIEGEGGSDQVIIQADDESCLVMQTEEATVSGLGLRCSTSGSRKNLSAVDIPHGRLIMRDCDITSNSMACIGIHNATARPHIVGCTIHDGIACGVFVYHSGTGLLEDCQIYGHADHGVEIIDGGNPTLRNCIISDGEQSGVFVGNRGAGILEDCQIFGNALAGVFITSHGNPIINGCTITNNRLEGIWLLDNGRGTVTNCDLRNNICGAWDIDDSSSVARSGNME